MSEPRISFDLGFAPDADPLRPGVVVDCLNFFPSERGMRTLGSVYPTDPTNTTDAPTFTSGFVIGHESFDRTVYGLADEYVGATDAVYARNGSTGAFSNVSRTAGYTSISAAVWSFERFGEAVIGAACSNDGVGDLIGGTLVQAASGVLGQLLDVAGAPTAGVITVAERFVLAFNGQGGNKDSWACCARDNHTSWTTSPATLANSGRLVDPVGAITAAKPLGNDVAVYKTDAIIIGRFVPGDPEVWKWQRTRHRVGAVSPRSVCVLDDGRHAFIGRESCYLFDGSNVLDVLDGKARKWYKQNRGTVFVEHKFGAHYDTANKLVWFTFPDADYSGLNALVFDPNTGRLGYVVLPAHILAITNDPFETGSRVPSYFDIVEARRWQFIREGYEGVPGLTHPGWSGFDRPYITSGDFGDRWTMPNINGLRLDVSWAADTGSLEAYLRSRDTRRYANVTEREGIAANGTDYERFDVRATAHWHRVHVSTQRAIELAGITFDAPNFGGRRK